MINHISFPGLGIEFEVNRVAFSVFGVDIFAYGLLIAIGMGIAFFYGSREAKRVQVKQDDLFNMVLLALPAAIIGARLYYVIFEWDSYKDNLSAIFNLREGGLAIYGGVIGAAVAIVSYCRIKKLSIGRKLDILAVGLLIGQAVGRWGNFVNGEAFGGQTSLPWAMTIVHNGSLVAESVHPTFLYESLWNAVGIAVLLFYKRKKVFDGEVFCGYMMWYGTGRAMIEGLRADSLYLGPLRVSQILSLCLVVAGVSIVIYKRKKLKKTLDK